MHAEALAYITAAAADFKPFPKSVIEIGSRDINGSPRPAFARAKSYVGIDVQGGSGVDVVADATKWEPDEPADCVVMAEVLEHAARPKALIEAAARMLARGGRLIVTCATDPRLPHSCVDGSAQLRDWEHYRNVDPDDLAEWLKDAGFVHVRIETHAERGDLYCTAAKR